MKVFVPPGPPTDTFSTCSPGSMTPASISWASVTVVAPFMVWAPCVPCKC